MIDINDLSPKMQEQARKQMASISKPVPPAATKRKGRNNKFNAQKTELQGVKFDSKKEARRFQELMLWQKAGEITDLRLQVNFTLIEGFTTTEGQRIKPLVYKADFTYTLHGCRIVEDVKSEATRKNRVYINKRKMMQDKLNIAIVEV